MHHECGLIGLYHVDQAATKTYYGLYALQHRGQEGCGIYTCDEQSFEGQKSFGMVRSVLEGRKSCRKHIRSGYCRDPEAHEGWRDMPFFKAPRHGVFAANGRNGKGILGVEAAEQCLQHFAPGFLLLIQAAKIL